MVKHSLHYPIRRLFGFFQSVILLLVLILIISSISPAFFSYSNFSNLLRQLSINLIVAAGMTFIILAGEIDMSVGSVLVLTAIASAKLFSILPVFPAMLISLCIGPCFGFFHGILVTKGNVPSFIVTLGTLMIGRSAAFLITQGKVLRNIPLELKTLNNTTVFGLPAVILLIIVLYGICYIILSQTSYGKKIVATGTDANIAHLSGIHTDRIKISAFVMCSLFASFAGIVIIARIGAIQAHTGNGMELESIAAVVIGGTSLTGGEGGIIRTVIGVFIIGFMRNAVNLMHMSSFWQDFITGSIILLAALLDTTRKKISRIM